MCPSYQFMKEQASLRLGEEDDSTEVQRARTVCLDNSIGPKAQGENATARECG
jgi:hypothetical protein